ncbi:MAG: NAD(P)/FAD-dependent oxidoreductase [Nocardioidaceae bacterium]
MIDGRMIDLVVAGGGPVGLATALYARRAGLSVVVVEPREGPIDKACGEGLMPGAVAALAALGVHPPGRPLGGIRYTDGQRTVEAEFSSGAGRGVRRTGLHQAVSDAVERAGIPVLRRPVDAVSQDADTVQVDDVRARYLAAADGLHSPVRRRLGLSLPTRSTPRYGLRRHFAVEPWTGLVEVHWGRGVEAYVTPVADDLVGVALLTSRRAGFEEQLRQFPALQARLPGCAATSARGAGPLRQRARCRVVGRVLLVGDAAGYVDALTGEGISVGLATARALVTCVAADRPGDYERMWRRASRRYRWLTEALLWSRNRPLLAPQIVPAARRLPRVFTAAVNTLAR